MNGYSAGVVYGTLKWCRFKPRLCNFSFFKKFFTFLCLRVVSKWYDTFRQSICEYSNVVFYIMFTLCKKKIHSMLKWLMTERSILGDLGDVFGNNLIWPKKILKNWDSIGHSVISPFDLKTWFVYVFTCFIREKDFKSLCSKWKFEFLIFQRYCWSIQTKKNLRYAIV